MKVAGSSGRNRPERSRLAPITRETSGPMVPAPLKGAMAIGIGWTTPCSMSTSTWAEAGVAAKAPRVRAMRAAGRARINRIAGTSPGLAESLPQMTAQMWRASLAAAACGPAVEVQHDILPALVFRGRKLVVGRAAADGGDRPVGGGLQHLGSGRAPAADHLG